MSDAGHLRDRGLLGSEATAAWAPYKGLTPYAEEDAPFFFGREAEREIIIANLLASRITLLYGASGVGKSSLLQAGVVHDLLASAKHNLVTRGIPDYLPVFFNDWSDDPVTGIIRSIRQSAAQLLDEQPAELEIDSPTLAAAIEHWNARLNSDLLIIFDQFEEYFLYHPQEDDERGFAVQFSRAANRLDLRVSFLLAMREDALAMLDRFKGRIPHLIENNLRIQHLDRQAAREAIERPLEQLSEHEAGPEPIVAEPDLVESVLDEIQIGKVTLGATGRGAVQTLPGPPSPGRRVETPYLQLVMIRLWDQERRVGSRVLRADTLRSLGGARRIVRTHLDQAMQTLSADAQDIAARVFHHLVTPSGSKIGHTAPDLADYTALPEASVTSVLRELSRGDIRVLRPLASLADPEHPRYEIFHDVLAPAILDWRARHLERLAAEAKVAARLEHEAAERRAAQQRAQLYRRRARNRSAALAVALLLVLVVATAGIVAVRAADNARRARTLANSVQLTASAVAELAADPAASIRLAMASLAMHPSQEAELALRRALAESHVRVVLHGHTDFVTSARFSPDGAYAVTGSNDHTVRIWRTQPGRQVAELRLPALSNGLSPPQFSPDGRSVLITGSDGQARIWGWQSPGGATMLAGARDITRATFAPDQQHVVSGHANGAIRVWDVRTGRLVSTLAGLGRDAWVNSIANDSRDRVAVGSDKAGCASGPGVTPRPRPSRSSSRATSIR